MYVKYFLWQCHIGAASAPFQASPLEGDDELMRACGLMVRFNN